MKITFLNYPELIYTLYLTFFTCLARAAESWMHLDKRNQHFRHSFDCACDQLNRRNRHTGRMAFVADTWFNIQRFQKSSSFAKSQVYKVPCSNMCFLDGGQPWYTTTLIIFHESIVNRPLNTPSKTMRAMKPAWLTKTKFQDIIYSTPNHQSWSAKVLKGPCSPCHSN